jgi:hypothetical protein
MPQLDDFSRFKNTELLLVDGKETYGRWAALRFLKERPPEGQIKVYQVTAAKEGRPDLIAQEVYGTPLLDWVLIAFNDVRDTLNWPLAGQLIEYPLDTVVLPALLG